MMSFLSSNLHMLVALLGSDTGHVGCRDITGSEECCSPHLPSSPPPSSLQPRLSRGTGQRTSRLLCCRQYQLLLSDCPALKSLSTEFFIILEKCSGDREESSKLKIFPMVILCEEMVVVVAGPASVWPPTCYLAWRQQVRCGHYLYTSQSGSVQGPTQSQ